MYSSDNLTSYNISHEGVIETALFVADQPKYGCDGVHERPSNDGGLETILVENHDADDDWYVDDGEDGSQPVDGETAHVVIFLHDVRDRWETDPDHLCNGKSDFQAPFQFLCEFCSISLFFDFFSQSDLNCMIRDLQRTEKFVNWVGFLQSLPAICFFISIKSLVDYIFVMPSI